MVGLLPRFRMEKWNITWDGMAGIEAELSSGMAVDYGFRALPQTCFVTYIKKGWTKSWGFFWYQCTGCIVVDETFIRKKYIKISVYIPCYYQNYVRNLVENVMKFGWVALNIKHADGQRRAVRLVRSSPFSFAKTSQWRTITLIL